MLSLFFLFPSRYYTNTLYFLLYSTTAFGWLQIHDSEVLQFKIISKFIDHN